MATDITQPGLPAQSAAPIPDAQNLKTDSNAAPHDVKVEAEAPKDAETTDKDAAAAGAKEKDEKFASKFAALSKREKSLVAREASLSEREKSYQSYEQAVKNARLNPIALLEAHGISYNELTKFVVDGGKVTPEMRVKALEERMEREQRETAEKQTAHQKAQEEQAITSFKSSISAQLEQGGDKFELTLKQPNAPEVVFSVIEEHYKENGRILTIEEAAEHVEKYLEAEADKLLSTKKLKGKYSAVDKGPKEEAKPAATSGAKTLTNAHQTQVPSNPPGKVISAEESKREAAKLLRWT